MKPAIIKLQENTSKMYQNALKVYRENDNSLAETTCIKALQMLEKTSGLVYEKALFYRLLANTLHKQGNLKDSLKYNFLAGEQLSRRLNVLYVPFWYPPHEDQPVSTGAFIREHVISASVHDDIHCH